MMMMMMMMLVMMMMMMMMMKVPHVLVAGSALVPMVLVVVGFQLLIHVKGQPLKALVPEHNIGNIGGDDEKINIDNNHTKDDSVIIMDLPIDVTLVGIVTDVSDVHPKKA